MSNARTRMMEGRTVYFATDHAGFALKNMLVRFVRDELGYETVDCGAHEFDPEDDFTDFIAQAAREVSARPLQTLGIILGGSGQGEAMLANRFHDVRAAVYYGGNTDIITLSREHNDANVLSLGARFITEHEAKEAVALWLATAHRREEKYGRRIREIESFSPPMAFESAALRYSLVPSLPPSSFEELRALCTSLKGISKGVQVDIVDGVFVPHTSWPFTENDVYEELQRIKEYTHDFEVEVDCMCVEPERFLDIFAAVGVRRVIIHYGSTHAYKSCRAHARTHRYLLGLAITNDTAVEKVHELVAQFDFIQVMGIREVGVQGQPFDERTLDTVARLRSAYPHMEIAIDGAVNAQTIPHLVRAGANRFAPGSAIAKANDPVAAYKQLVRILEQR